MSYRGSPLVEEVEQEEQDKLKAFCEEHYGKEACEKCHSATAENWCKNSPKYKKMIGINNEPN
jgi:hypothetical protein